MRKNMIRFTATLLAAATLSAPAFAEGDATAGEAVFNQCQSCHVVQDADGNTLAGRAAKTGPNLYGVVGRQAGSLEDFRYGDAIVQAGTNGLVWDEDNLAAYLGDPTKFLRDTLDDKKARSKMAYKVRKEEDAMNVAAFLATFSPAATEEAAPAATN
jgi:cytochrome c